MYDLDLLGIDELGSLLNEMKNGGKLDDTYWYFISGHTVWIYYRNI